MVRPLKSTPKICFVLSFKKRICYNMKPYIFLVSQIKSISKISTVFRYLLTVRELMVAISIYVCYFLTKYHLFQLILFIISYKGMTNTTHFLAFFLWVVWCGKLVLHYNDGIWNWKSNKKIFLIAQISYIHFTL